MEPYYNFKVYLKDGRILKLEADSHMTARHIALFKTDIKQKDIIKIQRVI